MDEETAVVLLADRNGFTQVSPAHLTKEKLAFFSVSGAGQLAQGRPYDQRLSHLTKPTITLPGNVCTVDAAVKICNWIANNDTAKPKPLMVADLGIDTFDQCVHLYRTSKAFALKREYRKDDVRDAIYEYIHASPLRFDEFAMILELLEFDTGLTKTAKHHVIFGKVKGGKQVAPDYSKIEDYCKRGGFWEKMLEIEKDIKAKFEAQKIEDAKQRIAAQADSFERGFPPLP